MKGYDGDLFQPDRISKREHYFFDSFCGALVTDVLDYLIFSEVNIDEKFRSDVKALRAKDLSPDLCEHCLENIKARFEIALPDDS
jgi:hypothetical protein